MHRVLSTLALMLLLTACAGEPAEQVVTEPLSMPGPSPFEYPVGLWDRRVSGEDPELASHLRIEELELEARGPTRLPA